MSVFIGKHIAKTLSEDRLLNSMVEGRIFPVTYAKSIDDKMLYPYIVYARESLTPVDEMDCKDYEDGEQTSVSIVVAAKKYEDLLEVVSATRKALIRNAQGHYDNMSVLDFKYRIGGEQYDYDEGAYWTEIVCDYQTE